MAGRYTTSGTTQAFQGETSRIKELERYSPQTISTRSSRYGSAGSIAA